MAKRIAEIVVLAEDLNQGSFVRHYLVARGQNWRTIRVRPFATGAGDQHVRERYPDEVAHYRSRSSHRSSALIVVTDADTRSVAKRERELEQELKSTGAARRRPSEAIVLLIPRRNIETWILCLSGKSVDERTDYKGSEGIGATKIKEAAQTFYNWRRSSAIPNYCVPSLRRGLVEVRRLP